MDTPYILARPEIVFIDQGQCEQPDLVVLELGVDTMLRCEVFGIPAPTVEWASNARSSLSMIVVPPDLMGGTVVNELIITNPTDLDVGSYTCTGRNGVGNVTQSINVIVQSESTISTDSVM